MHVMEIANGHASPNGALMYATQMAHQLADRGHRVSVLTMVDSWVARHVDTRRVTLVPSTLQRWPLGELRRVRDLVRTGGVDVLHTHGSKAHAFGALLRRLYGIPCVAHAHSTKRQIHWLANDHVIAVSESTRRFQIWGNLVPPRRVTTVLNPVDPHRHRPFPREEAQAFRRQLGLEPDTPLLGVLGTVRKGKGQLTAVGAMPRILAAQPAARLLIVGTAEGPYGQAVRQEAARLNVQPQVIWLPHRDDAPQILSALDVCLCPSIEEPFGFVAPEALSCGTPVVASRVGGFRETVLHERTGLLVKPRRPDELAAASLRLLADPSLRVRLAATGAAWVRSRLAPKDHFDKVTAILSRAAGAAATAAGARSATGGRSAA